APAPEATEEPAPEVTEAPASEALTATEKGFAGDVTVAVVLDAEGKIEHITIDVPNETEGFGKRCATEEFTAQFIGKQLGDHFDTLTGATVTSAAAIKAVNSLAPADIPAVEATEVPAPEVTEAPAEATEEPAPVKKPLKLAKPAVTEAPAEETAAPAPAKKPLKLAK
ncbi:MAG: FMN-binding protein, partial [Clostridia bacterium]|nr:FMN-binding protein [Clostridia bacterium]